MNFFLRYHFNSHAHVERDSIDAVADADQRDFNSHAHVERDTAYQKAVPTGGISTHTLTWSVTNDLCALYIMSLHFNSHAHVERDVKILI